MMQLWVLRPASGGAGLAVCGGDRVVTARAGWGLKQLETAGGRRACEDGQKKSSQISSAREEKRDHHIETVISPGQAHQTNKHTSRSEVGYYSNNRWSTALVAVAAAAGA